jgi:branched-chain amino acid transport system ATP-binding protein
MAEPKLLLMDEPTAGVNPALRDRLLTHIRRINEAGLTVLIVEHNLSVIEELCDDVIVMATGSVLRRGKLADLRRDADVVAAYLGGQHVSA